MAPWPPGYPRSVHSNSSWCTEADPPEVRGGAVALGLKLQGPHRPVHTMPTEARQEVNRKPGPQDLGALGPS